jgi:putative ABC transport system permease protein
MGIIIKFIIRNIREKKFRTFLIIFSITLSTALFFASLALGGTIERTFLVKVKKYIGTADIIIYANEKSPFWMFRLNKTGVVKHDLEYAVGSVETQGTYKHRNETVNFNLKGFYLDDLQKMNPYVLAGQADLAPFQGKKMIIAKRTAAKYRLQLGDKIELKIDDNRYRFKIVGFAEPMGFFQEDGQAVTAVVPRETLARAFAVPGLVGLAYVKVKDPLRTAAVIRKLSEAYRRYTVREPMSKAELHQYMQAISTPFLLMLVLVVFISVFIIYSSFKVITRERLPVIGTFRSIGATRKTTDLVLFAEGIFYGVMGGILGALLGLGILFLMSLLMRPDWVKDVKVTLVYSPLHLLAAFLLAVILPFLGSFFPIVKLSKFSIKDVIFNTIEKPKPNKSVRLIMGLFLLIFVFTAPWLVPKSLALVMNIICMVAAVTAVILLVPVLTSGFLKLFEWVYEFLLGNEGVLAAKNLRENKSILNNISLLAIGISSILMINTVSFSVVKEIVNFYKDAAFDIWIHWADRADRSFEGVLRNIEGVTGVCGVYTADRVEIDGSKDRINLIHGVNGLKYFDYWKIPLDSSRQAAINQLDAGRTIMLSYILKEKLGVKKGDTLTLRMKRGQRAYKIAGFFTSLMWGGNFALVGERYLKTDMQLQYYGNLYLKAANDPDSLVAVIKKRCARKYPNLETVAEMAGNDERENRKIFQLLQGFSIMTLIIGVFGIFNNLMISFIERRRSLAMMRSVGMSRSQTWKIILIESLTGGIIGGGVGLLAGTVLIWLLPFMLRAINQGVQIHYSLKEYGLAMFFGIVITVAASIGPALKSSRFNIIEAIKYE